MKDLMTADKVIFDKKRAVQYDTFSQTWMPNYATFCQWLSDMFQFATPNDVQDILVVGCGTGQEVKALLDKNIHWQITGIDPSPEMLRIAKEKLKEYPVINLIEGEVQHLPFKPQFDAATLLLVLHFIPDNGAKSELLWDIGARLKPGSPLVIADVFGSEAELAQNLALLKSILPPSVSKKEIEERFHKIRTKMHYITEKRLAALLHEAGFSAPVRYFQSTIYGGWVCWKS